MATQADFWGELQIDEIRTPVSILRQQAALLGPKTQNLVEAEVATKATGNNFTHSFSLVVPALDNYTYRLFVISHEIALYPIWVLGDGKTLRDEEQFKAWLQEKLSSEETRRTVTNLIAQTRDL